jgi:tryptophanase
LGFGGLITGLGIAGFAALAGGVSLGCIDVVAWVLSCRDSVVCSGFCSTSGVGIFGFITGRGITGFAIGLLTGACSDFVSAGISVVGTASRFILSSATDVGSMTGRGITGFAIGLLTGACSDFVSADGSMAGISVSGVA